jgi:Raf kinase inhibitor-like YbhB/YbcL family protein
MILNACRREVTMNRLFIAMVMTAAVTLAACEPEKEESVAQNGGASMTLQVTSSAFQDGGMIPPKYTADGADVSPPLAWEGMPEGTKSFALICDDPDAPMGTWVHWVMWNIPPEVMSLDEGIPAVAELADGSQQGTTDFRRIGYGGPAPPSGTHRYFFKVYALDTTLDLDSATTKAKLVKAMTGHVLAQGQLVGKYTRQK